MKQLRLPVFVLVFLAAGSLALGAQAPAAYAQTHILSCIAGTQMVNYNPPLTNTPGQTTVDIAEHYSPCVNLSDLTLISGDASFTVTENASCTSLNQAVDNITYHWSTGQSSTVLFSSTTVARLADGTTDVTSIGSVTSGFASGAPATREVILPQLDLAACSGMGVSQESGLATLIFG